MSKLLTSKFEYFIDVYMEKAKALVILDRSKPLPAINPIDKLIITHQDFLVNEEDEKYINVLIAYAFEKYEDYPNQAKVQQELITNPRIDYLWFRLLDNYLTYQ